jgi:hypothetical protein
VRPRTLTLPPTDSTMWRKLLAAAHPDSACGSHELFVWAAALREHVVGGAIEPPKLPRYTPMWEAGPDRVSFDPTFGAEPDFWDLTHRALSVGRSVEEPYRSVLALLLDCDATDHGRRAERQMRGASYKQLALIAHSVGMSKAERVRWYEVACCIPLADQHAHHIISWIKKAA